VIKNACIYVWRLKWVCTKSHPKLPGLVLPSSQKLSFTLEVIPSCAYALFPALLPFGKCITEIVFSTACLSASITSLVSNGGLSVLSSIEETEN
jgi:hypothetical protein